MAGLKGLSGSRVPVPCDLDLMADRPVVMVMVEEQDMEAMEVEPVADGLDAGGIAEPCCSTGFTFSNLVTRKHYIDDFFVANDYDFSGQ